MEVSESDVQQVEARMQALRSAGYAVSARYDAQQQRVAVRLQRGACQFSDGAGRGAGGRSAGGFGGD